jgi:hypothetical protein
VFEFKPNEILHDVMNVYAAGQLVGHTEIDEGRIRFFPRHCRESMAEALSLEELQSKLEPELQALLARVANR